MKKLISIVLLLALTVCALASCSHADKKDEADTTAPEVTSPDGFDDVTAPPEDTTGKKKDETTAADTTAAIDPEKIVTNADEAVAAAREWLGESDPDTGYKYAYSYDGSTFDDDGKPLFRVRVSWYLEEQERYSLCGFLLVSPTGEITKYSW